MPIEFWTQGRLLDPSPAAAALFLVLLHELHPYGLSSDTCTKATQELVQHLLLKVGQRHRQL